MKKPASLRAELGRGATYVNLITWRHAAIPLVFSVPFLFLSPRLGIHFAFKSRSRGLGYKENLRKRRIASASHRRSQSMSGQDDIRLKV